MRPYRINAGKYCQVMWIDLDHILAVHDPLLPDATDVDQLWRCLPPSFSMVLAFRNDALTYTSVPPLSISVEERQKLLDNIQRAHAELLVAWKNNL